MSTFAQIKTGKLVEISATVWLVLLPMKLAVLTMNITDHLLLPIPPTEIAGATLSLIPVYGVLGRDVKPSDVKLGN